MSKQNATIDDVAELAGVSIKTVSRVVNREPNVREETRSRVNDAISTLSYRPNASARKLAGNRSYLVALIYEDPSDYEIPSSGYIVALQQGMLAACKPAAYDLLIHPYRLRDNSARDEIVTMIDHARPDGIVLAAPLSDDPEIISTIEKKKTRLVRLSPGELSAGKFSVATNDREICAAMVAHLVSLGHHRISFIKGDPTHKAVGNRFLGYKDGLVEAGLPFSKKFVAQGDNSIASGEEAGRHLLSRDDRPTAIFAANDDMAAGVIRIALETGLRVPQDLSVAGFDDIALAQQIFPSLTTIRQPLVSMSKRAAELMISGSDFNGTDSQSNVVPASLRLRNSTGPAPA